MRAACRAARHVSVATFQRLRRSLAGRAAICARSASGGPRPRDPSRFASPAACSANRAARVSEQSLLAAQRRPTLRLAARARHVRPFGARRGGTTLVATSEGRRDGETAGQPLELAGAGGLLAGVARRARRHADLPGRPGTDLAGGRTGRRGRLRGTGPPDVRQHRNRAQQAGASLDAIVKLTVYLTDIGRLRDFTRVKAELLPGPQPASTAVQVGALALPGMLVEVEAFAVA